MIKVLRVGKTLLKGVGKGVYLAHVFIVRVSASFRDTLHI